MQIFPLLIFPLSCDFYNLTWILNYSFEAIANCSKSEAVRILIKAQKLVLIDLFNRSSVRGMFNSQGLQSECVIYILQQYWYPYPPPVENIQQLCESYVLVGDQAAFILLRVVINSPMRLRKVFALVKAQRWGCRACCFSTYSPSCMTTQLIVQERIRKIILSAGMHVKFPSS